MDTVFKYYNLTQAVIFILTKQFWEISLGIEQYVRYKQNKLITWACISNALLFK